MKKDDILNNTNVQACAKPSGNPRLQTQATGKKKREEGSEKGKKTRQILVRPERPALYQGNKWSGTENATGANQKHFHT